jgi:signal peptidase I
MTDDDAKRESLLSTWVKAMVNPSALYEAGATGKKPAEPHVFAVVFGFLASLGGGLADALISKQPAAGALGTAIASPVLTIFLVYLSAVLVHFWLLVVRGRNGTFRDTVASTCYARAPLVLAVVPVVGIFVGYLWNVVALCIGLKHAHRTTIWRASFAAIAGSPVLLALFLRAAVVEAYKIPSAAMTPSIVLGDHLYVEKLTYGPLIPWTDARLYSGLPPRRGDVMVFKFPENKAQDFIKRAIAVPGDTLEAINGRPVINGWLVPHCHVGPFRYDGHTAELFVEHLGGKSYFTQFDADPDEQRCDGTESCGAGLACRGGICGVLQGPFKVVPEEVWVMGDNRDNSHDSRSWRGGRGAGVPFENIKGRATFVWIGFLPDGSVAKDRIFVSLNGKPTLPAGYPELEGAVAKCLQERPPVAQTTPPGP